MGREARRGSDLLVRAPVKRVYEVRWGELSFWDTGPTCPFSGSGCESIPGGRTAKVGSLAAVRDWATAKRLLELGDRMPPEWR